VLALFMAEGHFERHLRRMRKVYRARRDALVAALDEHLAGRARVSGTASGIHLLVAVAAVADPAAFVQRAAELGVRVQDARPYYSGALAEATFIMGYSSIPLARIPEGVRRLASVLSRTAPQNSER
jgi:GntR family transcriptional regulator/MocR family aminotransferase